MKRYLSALSLGLAAAATGTSAFANTGTINFEGRITAGTCPIEVDPIDGGTGSLVKMGTVPAAAFTGSGVEKAGKDFVLRTGSPTECGVTGTTQVANVTFNGNPEGDYFALIPGSDTAVGVAIGIKDLTNAMVRPGVASADYPLSDTNPTDMRFTAVYVSTAAAVTAGRASADVNFTVTIN
jgi:type 1 fimbria pilin